MTFKRRPVVVGNWKMNLSLTEATELARSLLTHEGTPTPKEGVVEVGVAPSTPFLGAVIAVLEGSEIDVSAQHMSHHRSGAHTGESAPNQLADLGCRYVILGHSERRQLYHETDQQVSLAARAAHDVGLIPILCIGETLDQRDQGDTLNVVLKQLSAAFSQLTADEAIRSICAYEPVWAIGTGRTATPAQAQEVHSAIRQHLSELYGEQVADRVRLQYGGSVKPTNAEGLMSQPDIDGALIGGASLNAVSFQAIINIASTVR
jgi:triosephosphate isomerase (TIM)